MTVGTSTSSVVVDFGEPGVAQLGSAWSDLPEEYFALSRRDQSPWSSFGPVPPGIDRVRVRRNVDATEVRGANTGSRLERPRNSICPPTKVGGSG